jgi:hypothetical protein
MTPHTPRRRLRGTAVAAMATAALVLLPAAGNAAVTTIGSDLSKQANVMEAHGADALFFNTLIDGNAGAVPADGQITFARIKGVVLDDPLRPRNPDPMFHLQVLHPIGGGQMRVMLSSAPFRLPVVRDLPTSDTQQVSGYKPVNLCVRKGDYVDFNDFGGHEWSWGRYPTGAPIDGMHVQAFSAARESTTGFYTKNNGTNNNSEWTPQEYKQGEELLMQEKLSTGPDATDFCPGGYMQHIFKGLAIRTSSASLSSRKRQVKVSVQCPVNTNGGCKGLLVLKANLGGTPTTLGGVAFNVKRSFGTGLLVTLSSKMVSKIKKLGGAKATATATAHDDPRNSQADASVPVQKKVTHGTIKIVPSS